MAKKKTESFDIEMSDATPDIPDVDDLLRRLEDLTTQAAEAEDRYAAEHKLRLQERSAAEGQQLTLHRKILSLTEAINNERQNAARAARQRKATIPGFVVAAAAAFLLLLVPNCLQQLSLIGPQLSFTLQALLMMAMSFCYAIIWERTRK